MESNSSPLCVSWTLETHSVHIECGRCDTGWHTVLGHRRHHDLFLVSQSPALREASCHVVSSLKQPYVERPTGWETEAVSQEPHMSESSEGPGHSSHSKAQLTFFFLIFIFFLTVQDLHCCKQTFSSFSERGLFSSCSTQTSHCSNFLVLEHKL